MFNVYTWSLRNNERENGKPYLFFSSLCFLIFLEIAVYLFE
jgi:hypothetical protein